MKLIHGDCIKVMKTMPQKSVDLVVTDPPYGMEYLSNHYKNGNPFAKIVGDDKPYPSELIKVFKTLTRKAIFCFCRWDNLKEVEKPKSFIVWAKNNWTAGDLKHEYGRSWEGILFYPLTEHIFSKRPPDIYYTSRVPSRDLLHPTQKPIKLLEWIIKNNSNQGDVVLDPFMGSGTTGVACHNLNRKFIGIELDADYFAKKLPKIVIEEEQKVPSFRFGASAPSGPDYKMRAAGEKE